MLSYLRRTGRLAAPVAVVLAVMVVVGTTDWWHANDAEDSAPVFHDHASHHATLKSPRSNDARPGEHCYLCHWLRSFQNGLRACSTYALTDHRTQHVYTLASSAPRHAATTLLPARAPPV
jgi:hypothetical protein